MRIILTCSLYFMLLFGYQHVEDKFVGKWKPANKKLSYEKDWFLIRKKGNQYIVSKVSDAAERIILTYNKKGEFLSGNVKGLDLELKYLPAKDHLTLLVVGDTTVHIELKRVN